MVDPVAVLRRKAAIPIFLGLTILTQTVTLGAQEVRGRVMETGSGEPIVSASIMLLDSTFAVVAGTMTNQTGAFLLEAPAPGAYYVLAEALGYEPYIDGIIDLGVGGSISVEIYVQPKPIEMDSIKVAVERVMTYQHLQKQGFYDRQTTGFGHFITPEEIQRRNPRYFADLFRASPGVVLEGGGALSGTRIQLSNTSVRGPTCTPPIYVNGIQVDQEMGGLETAVDISQIAAVEVYARASSVPLQWGGTNAGCGVVLIWTR